MPRADAPSPSAPRGSPERAKHGGGRNTRGAGSTRLPRAATGRVLPRAVKRVEAAAVLRRVHEELYAVAVLLVVVDREGAPVAAERGPPGVGATLAGRRVPRVHPSRVPAPGAVPVPARGRRRRSVLNAQAVRGATDGLPVPTASRSGPPAPSRTAAPGMCHGEFPEGWEGNACRGTAAFSRRFTGGRPAAFRGRSDWDSLRSPGGSAGRIPASPSRGRTRFR